MKMLGDCAANRHGCRCCRRDVSTVAQRQSRRAQRRRERQEFRDQTRNLRLPR